MFKGWTDEQLRSISAPALVINGNKDVGSIEHAVEMYRAIPNCTLAVLPGAHGAYLGALESLPNGEWTMQFAADLILDFLEKAE